MNYSSFDFTSLAWQIIDPDASNIVTKIRNKDGQTYAVKIIKIDSMNQSSIVREAQLQYSLNYKYIVKLLCYFRYNGLFYMIMPLYSCNLNSFVSSHKITSEFLSKFVFQLFSTLVYLKCQQIIHCDIKLANILLDSEENIMVGDFGIATTNSAAKKAEVGTFHYQAPEILESDVYSYSTDVWSAGVVLLHLVLCYLGEETQLAAYESRVTIEEYQVILSSIHFDEKTQIFRPLLRAIFTHEKQRISAETILETVYFGATMSSSAQQLKRAALLLQNGNYIELNMLYDNIFRFIKRQPSETTKRIIIQQIAKQLHTKIDRLGTDILLLNTQVSD